jgi:hypothetical protein
VNFFIALYPEFITGRRAAAACLKNRFSGSTRLSVLKRPTLSNLENEPFGAKNIFAQ